MLNIFVEQILFGRPQGEHPGPDWVVSLFALFIGLGVPALLLSLQLTVKVDAEGIHIRYRPFVRRTIRFNEIRAFCARRYRPIREFGGWGIRSGLGEKSAYNAQGDRGVELYFNDGRSVMIGSQRHEELAEALRRRGIAEEASGGC